MKEESARCGGGGYRLGIAKRFKSFGIAKGKCIDPYGMTPCKLANIPFLAVL